MRTTLAFALGAILGAPILATATDEWIPAIISWSGPQMQEGGIPSVTMTAELPSDGTLVSETNGVIDSFGAITDDRACLVDIPKDTTFRLSVLSSSGASYMVRREGGKPVSVKYSREASKSSVRRNVDPNPYMQAAASPSNAREAPPSRERRISPRPLLGTTSLRCSSDTVAAAGVWHSGGK